jgi:hypothetical protein
VERKDEQFRIYPDLNVITHTAKKMLEIALGVLRSGTDHADFLNFWLCDYGSRVLSPNPPCALLQDVSDADMSRNEFGNLPWFSHASIMIN